MGIRGIPASYGGFETMAEELSLRLVQRGHDVTVYGRANVIDYSAEYYNGVRIKILPTISHKYLDTVFHTLLSTLHAISCPYDVILICNAANSIFSLIPRMLGKKVAVNVDGIERLRKKWNWLGKLWYLYGEIFAVILPNKIISDAKVIRDYYQKRYNKDSVFIPYGARTEKVATKDVLDRFGLVPNEYILYVSRLEPENNAHIVIEAFEKIETDKKLVIVGDAPYSKKYIENLRRTTDPRILFTGYVFGQGYHELQSHAYCYIHATEVGGTHPALIESMGFGNCVIANGTPENQEVLQQAGLIYKKNNVDDLQRKIQITLDNAQTVADFGVRARQIVMTEYNWDAVTDKYESLFKEMLKNKK
jgi:glycosyltransferase involved in cell wall biosynthesis